MVVNAKLGCLKTAERMPANPIHGAGTVRSSEQYDTALISFERPETGVACVELECPTCGQPLSFQVASADRVQLKMIVAAAVASALVAAGGWWLWSNFGGHVVGIAGQGLMGLGGIGVALTVLLGVAAPGVFDISSEFVSLASTGTSSVDMAPGIEVEQHKLLAVWIRRGVACSAEGQVPAV